MPSPSSSQGAARLGHCDRRKLPKSPWAPRHCSHRLWASAPPAVSTPSWGPHHPSRRHCSRIPAHPGPCSWDSSGSPCSLTCPRSTAESNFLVNYSCIFVCTISLELETKVKFRAGFISPVRTIKSSTSRSLEKRSCSHTWSLLLRHNWPGSKLFQLKGPENTCFPTRRKEPVAFLPGDGLGGGGQGRLSPA